MTVADLLSTAFLELGIVEVTATLPAELSTLGLRLLNRILDDWNADRHAVYSDVHTTPAALTAGLNPHTIGPSGATFTATTNRPVTIEGIRLTDDDGETYFAPLTPRQAAWWHARPFPGATSTHPTDFYYDATFPNGSIYFAPEPSSASVKAQLWYRIVLAQVATTDTVSVPPGYVSALTETLKERLTQIPMWASMASQDIKDAARLARSRAFGNNAPVQPLRTADSGLGGGCDMFDIDLGPYSLMR